VEGFVLQPRSILCGRGPSDDKKNRGSDAALEDVKCSHLVPL